MGCCPRGKVLQRVLLDENGHQREKAWPAPRKRKKAKEEERPKDKSMKRKSQAKGQEGVLQTQPMDTHVRRVAGRGTCAVNSTSAV